MKINLFSILLLFFFSTNIRAQTSYPLHPSVGDTIESIEKLDYSLFPFVPNNGFEYGCISFEENEFYLNAVFQDSTIKYPLNQHVIIEAQQNIEKINAYYRLKVKSEQEAEAKADYNADRPTGKDPVFYNKAMNDQINKEARMQLRIKEDQRRLQNIPGDILPNRMRIEFN